MERIYLEIDKEQAERLGYVNRFIEFSNLEFLENEVGKPFREIVENIEIYRGDILEAITDNLFNPHLSLKGYRVKTGAPRRNDICILVYKPNE